MVINRKERLWNVTGGEGTFAVFSLHDTVDITEAIYGGSTTYAVNLDVSKDLLKQVVAAGLELSGNDGSPCGNEAASYANVWTLTGDGTRVPKEDKITVKNELGTIQFGHLLRRDQVCLIEDTRGEPKETAPLDREWVCHTRCGINQYVMKTDIVVATPLSGADHIAPGTLIYNRGVVDPEWIKIVPALRPAEPECILAHNSPLTAGA